MPRQNVVVSLVRVSTTDQAADDRGGVPRQRESIRRTIESRGLRCIRHFEISDVSGTNVRNTPEVQTILAMVASQEIAGVVVADLDRLLRADQFEDYILLQVFQSAKATLFCGDSSFDFGSPDGVFSAAVRAAVSGLELSTIRKRMQGSKEAKRKQGKCPSSKITLPRGVAYDRASETYSYTADVLAVVEAFRMVDELGITNQTEIGAAVGIAPRTLHNLLRNPIYRGHRIYSAKRGADKYPSKNGRQSDRRKVQRAPEEIIDVEVISPPAVSPERWHRVQLAIAETHGRWTQKRSDVGINLAVGVARCGHCGSRLYCSSGKRAGRASRGYYFCSKNSYLMKRQTGGCAQRHVYKAALDETLRLFTATHLSSERVLRRIVTHALQSHRERLSQIATVDDAAGKARDLETRLARLLRLYEISQLDEETYFARRDALRRDLTALSVALAQSSQVAAVDVKRTARLIVRGAKRFAKIEDAATQKRAIAQLFSQVVFRDEAIVGFRLLPRFVSELGIHEDMDSSLPRA